MDYRTRYEDFREAMETVVEARLVELRTAEHSNVASWDPQKQTMVGQPTSKALLRKPDGTKEWVQMPQVPDVKVHYPSGGGVTFTHPLVEGDEVLLVMASRSPDVWQQSGGDQQIIDTRLHDLSNAFCIPGFKSDPKALPAVSTISGQIRNDAATHVVDHNPLTGTTVTAEGTKVKVTATSVLLVSGDPYVA
ncbi:Gp138 family membrane-puncturing spike protein [Xanthobacter sp. V3C-3]|uniref:Gp138 family membrane-puncturing spike protein n=1 Tax=Xanthobacter lutulentifluminis TaxID=3119935 RepID=UPI00372B39C8